MDLIGRVVELGVAPRGVIHVGAARGEELPFYQKHEVTNQLWIEPQPDLFRALITRLPLSSCVQALNVACGNFNGKAKMICLLGNGGHSNSLLHPKKHLEYHPDNVVDGEIEVDVARLDDIVAGFGIPVHRFNVMVLDVQGYELEVLKGGEGTVIRMEAVVCEVNREELYEECALADEVDRWMEGRGFTRRWTCWCGPNESYGDAIYLK